MNHGVDDVLFDINATVTGMPSTAHFVPGFNSSHSETAIWDGPDHRRGQRHDKGITAIRHAKL